jgi:hypothetical protein
VQRRAILLLPQCGDITSCIRHLVLDRLLSLNSKENVQNAEHKAKRLVLQCINDVSYRDVNHNLELYTLCYSHIYVH